MCQPHVLLVNSTRIEDILLIMQVRNANNASDLSLSQTELPIQTSSGQRLLKTVTVHTGSMRYLLDMATFMTRIMFSLPLISQVGNPLQAALLADLSSALIAHAWFRKYEPDNITSCLSQLVVFAIAPVIITTATLPSPLTNVPLHLALFASLLLFSIVLYRISPFHPLAKHPGPVICKVTKLWFAWLSYKGKSHLYFRELHKKYGPIVRIGPNELSITEAPLIPHIMGQQGMRKGPMWHGRAYVPGVKAVSVPSLVGIRDISLHAKHRKPWNRAFGPAALKDYEDSLVVRGTELIEHLKAIIRKSPDGVGHTDISMYISNWSFDFMGDAILGEDFQLMSTGDKDGIVRSLDEAHLSAANMDIDDDQPPLPLIMASARLAIVAGSHTTSFVITSIMYHLLRYPEYFRRLQQELDTNFPPSEQAVIQVDKLSNLELLDAIINEALRLQPPIATYLQRAPPAHSGGKLLKDIFIPEGTSVVVPPYVIHRDKRYFSPNPDQFWPERWYVQNEKTTTDRTAFIPFSYGPANCVGRPLALQEVRYITAMLVYNFDFSFQKGYNPDQWDMDLIDQFIFIKGKLPVEMKQRNV
ncbi:hypothetical protein Clacol_003064 [Clathrus columnatus]|uniref:Cytochrome P450 n=1 Tax=Clathrus columnatus TaxID=1419009 RepID=A0AAV5AA95_9AGAM|nr:hypothetical protein Clacol_003064 [Clathrus columnatus]